MTDTTEQAEGTTRRARILEAAMRLFMTRGYAGTSTLAIASEARVSKRDLYAAFAGKRDILATCVQSRATAMKSPLELPPPRTRAELYDVLVRYGIGLRMGITRPEVIATYRLIILEAQRSPETAQTLDAEGRAANYTAVHALLEAARVRGLLGAGDAATMARRFLCLLVGDLVLQHLLGVAPPETEALARQHAETAADLLFALHAPPQDK